jgi:hypothetical protein
MNLIDSIVNVIRKLIPDVRNQIVKWALEGVTDEDKKMEFIYQEVRPIDLVWKKPIRIDCSGYCILVYFKAGGRDPSGNNFNGIGNSDSLFSRGKHITLAQLHKGDIITFGPNGSVHAVIALERGGDPLCASMGQQGDPSTVRLSVLKSLGEPTFLRFSTRNRRL